MLIYYYSLSNYDVIHRTSKIGADQATGATNTWRALLPATAASFQPHNITASYNGVTLSLTAVMFGEVWICSGYVSWAKSPLSNRLSAR